MFGNLLFLGRADTQMKIRGHRIEPGAVEAAVRSHPHVNEVAVASRTVGKTASNRLVAFVSSAQDGLDTNLLRTDLREALPGFMVPDIIVPLPELPRLPNGKTDYTKLPQLNGLEAGTAGNLPPRDDTERRMAAVWASILGIDESAVGSNADYFALGGDSLLAIRLISAVHKEFGTTLPLSALLEAPRLDDFSKKLGSGPDERPSVLVPIRGEGRDTLFMIHPGGGNVLTYEAVARHLPDSTRIVGVQAHGVEGDAEPDQTIEAMGRRYATAIDEFMPTGIVHLAGHSTGGLVAYETAWALEAMGRRVGLVALLDTLYPLGVTLRERIARQINTVREGGWRGVRTVGLWYWATLRGLGGKARHGPKWNYRLARGQTLPPVLAGKRINHIALRAQRVYQPRPYGGTITYLRAIGDQDRRVQNSARLWATVATNVEVRDAPGHHTGEESMVTEPHAQTVARIIGDALEALDNRV